MNSKGSPLVCKRQAKLPYSKIEQLHLIDTKKAIILALEKRYGGEEWILLLYDLTVDKEIKEKFFCASRPLSTPRKIASFT